MSKHIPLRVGHNKFSIMRNYPFFICLAVFVLCMQAGFSQSYKAGDKAEAFINNAWKEVTIVKAVAGKSNIYEVRSRSLNSVNTIQVNKNNLRVGTRAVTANTSQVPQPENSLHLGRYDLYSGIPTMYLGHLILLADGKYKVAFSTDEENYETGNYLFHPGSNTIEWLSGMFRSNGWTGKLSSKGANIFRIEFNKATYAETN
jgi:hypothetical protein